jgi:hypothetical protein
MKKYINILAILVSIIFSKDKVGFIADVDGYVEILPKDRVNVLELEALEGRYIYEGDIIRSYGKCYKISLINIPSL